MNVKLQVTKSQMYQLIKDHVHSMCPDIKIEELSKLKDCEFQKASKYSYYQLNFSTKHKWYKANLQMFSGSGYLQIKSVGADTKNEWQKKIEVGELKERGMLGRVPVPAREL